MKIGSLFSGIGGIELGFERAGDYKTIWFVENEPYAQAILHKHWPNTPIYGDITKIDFTKLPKPDILTGGFPCQDISLAGKGKGIQGQRSGLWKEFHRAISQIQPKYALIENVSALTFRGLSNVLADLAQIRYDAEWFSIQARNFGALHKRERIFIITYPERRRFNWRKYKKGRNSDKYERTIKESFITNNWQERIQGFRQKTLQGKQGFSWCQNVRRIEDLQGRHDIPKPLIRRNCNGFSNRVDRTKCLGNAVVPQCAQFFAEIIKEKEQLK